MATNLALHKVTAAIAARGDRPLPLLVLRIAELERRAWREGRPRAWRLEREIGAMVRDAARGVLRRGDAVGHRAGSTEYLAVLAAPSRRLQPPSAADCRAVLERLCVPVAERAGVTIARGWTILVPGDDAALDVAVERAIERGERERERYAFFATVGHELRTPLTSIRGYLETVIDGGLDAPTTARFLEIAQRETLRLGRMVDGMFEFSLLDLSAAGGRDRWCDLGAQIERACEIVQPRALERGIELEIRTRAAVRVAIDADAASHVLVNLLENAIKHGLPGGHVRVCLDIRADMAVLDVDDDGPGIAAAEREAIFALGARASNATAAGGGIGLALAKLIAERAGGGIVAGASSLGGARFEMVLPLKAESGVPVS